METTVAPMVSRATGQSVGLAGLRTATPRLVLAQNDVLKAFSQRWPLSSLPLYRRMLSHPSVERRCFAADGPDELFDLDPDRTALRFERWAVRLGAEALSSALSSSGVRRDELDVLITTTCTGYLCPGLSSRIVEALDLPRGIVGLDMVGMGCGAAAPALETARRFTAGPLERTAAVVCVEICSAALHPGDAPDLILSNALFGDGAAAAVLNNGESAPAGLKLIDTSVRLRPEWKEGLRFRIEQGRLRNVLDRRVPEQAAELASEVIGDLLERHELDRDNISRWIVHPGGAKILDAVRDRLGLAESALSASRAVLRSFGNLSSAAVLAALERSLLDAPARPGERIMLVTFGAGFSAYAVLLEGA